MLRNRFFDIALLSTFLLAGCSESTQQDAVQELPTLQTASTATLYTNFTLIDGTGAAPQPGYAMTVDEGRVTWTGPVSGMQASDAAEVVNLSGKYVMPGIIDLHTHVSVVDNYALDHNAFTMENLKAELETYASYGVTSVLSMGTEKDLVYDLIAEQRSGFPAEARIYTAGQGIMLQNGYGGVVGINQPVSTIESAVSAVESQVSKGADFIKLWVDNNYGTMDILPAEITAAAIETAHKHGKRVLVHIHSLDDAKRLAQQGADGFAHSVRDSDVDAELLALMRENGIWQVASTLSRERSAFTYGERPPFLDDPFFYRAVPPQILAMLSSEEFQERAAANPLYARYPSYFEAAKRNLRAIANAGIRYGFGTDAGPPGRFPGFSAHWELELMVEAGFTPAQAIQAATGHAGEFLDADTGMLASGKWADFIVLNASPIEDIRNTREIHAVFIAGQQSFPNQ